MMLVCGGCQFSVNALAPNGLGQSDLGVGGDLATVDTDLAANDLAPGPDIADPCGTPPALGAGNIAAQCVIGSPPTIDGDLSDWTAASLAGFTHVSAAQSTGAWDPVEATNDGDSSARFFVKWDLNYLYIAAAISDDIRETPNNTGPGLTDNDALEIFLDGAHNRTQAYDSTDWQLIISADNKKAAFQNAVAKTFPSGIMFALGGASPSWNVEVAIPWASVGGSGTIGRVLGFDIKLDDNDSGNTTRDRGLVMYYTAVGAGSPPCSALYCRTDSFGAVQLQGR
ncbi:MAG: Ig domain protein group 2 domain protein [Myxococcales bacterium]|nr:Ig domain protein group 2 domain protein [Myxococcales bacterium]